MRHKKISGHLAAAALCAVMSASAGLIPAMDVWAAYDKVNGSYQMLDGTVVERAIARGIDVSRWQGNIDWQAVAADDVSFVMLGTRSKGVVDPYFHSNIQGASAAGLKVGAYIYSLATTPDMAREEADFVLDLVKGYPISFPIAFDAEDSATLGSLPPAQVSEIINAFCERIEEAGYYPIVYANDYWLSSKIDLTTMKHDVWVARYDVMHKYADPIMWQISSTGSINGINGNVDIDFLYRDLTPKLPGSLWRTIGGKTYYYQNYHMQKDTWINDGTGWFYMNNEGQASTGWLELNGLHYYLDETAGRMVTGWREVAGSQYFFHDSGAMNTGWLDNNGSRYYFNPDGVMAKGWQLIDNQYYYLDALNGSMAVGWKQLDGKWYFLKDDGAMATGWLDNNGARYYLNDDGSMAVGWKTDHGYRYYLAENGAASTGWKAIDNSWYYFSPEGAMANGWINPDGNWYYLADDGRMQSGWLDNNGGRYFLSTSSGKMTIGWRQVDGYWYYFNGSGAMVTGMNTINGQQYYFNPADGKMASSITFTVDGISYTADGNGICVKTAETGSDQTGDPAQQGDQQQNTPEGTAPVPETSAENPVKEIGPGIH